MFIVVDKALCCLVAVFLLNLIDLFIIHLFCQHTVVFSRFLYGIILALRNVVTLLACFIHLCQCIPFLLVDVGNTVIIFLLCQCHALGNTFLHDLYAKFLRGLLRTNTCIGKLRSIIPARTGLIVGRFTGYPGIVKCLLGFIRQCLKQIPVCFFRFFGSAFLFFQGFYALVLYFLG